MKTNVLTATVTLVLCAALASEGRAQTSAGHGYAGGAQYFGNSYQRSAGPSNPALSYFAGNNAALFAARPRSVDAMPSPQPVQLGGLSKPFANLRRGPSISPYLSLDVRESATGVPVYYSSVKPQLDQIQHNRAMEAENARMQQQLRSATASGIISQNTSGGIPTTGHSTQFMNLGGYYPGMR